jgi:hypothetical protein
MKDTFPNHKDTTVSTHIFSITHLTQLHVLDLQGNYRNGVTAEVLEM